MGTMCEYNYVYLWPMTPNVASCFLEQNQCGGGMCITRHMCMVNLVNMMLVVIYPLGHCAVATIIILMYAIINVHE